MHQRSVEVISQSDSEPQSAKLAEVTVVPASNDPCRSNAQIKMVLVYDKVPASPPASTEVTLFTERVIKDCLPPATPDEAMYGVTRWQCTAVPHEHTCCVQLVASDDKRTYTGVLTKADIKEAVGSQMTEIDYQKAKGVQGYRLERIEVAGKSFVAKDIEADKASMGFDEGGTFGLRKRAM